MSVKRIGIIAGIIALLLISHVAISHSIAMRSFKIWGFTGVKYRKIDFYMNNWVPVAALVYEMDSGQGYQAEEYMFLFPYLFSHAAHETLFINRKHISRFP